MLRPWSGSGGLKIAWRRGGVKGVAEVLSVSSVLSGEVKILGIDYEAGVSMYAHARVPPTPRRRPEKGFLGLPGLLA